MTGSSARDRLAFFSGCTRTSGEVVQCPGRQPLYVLNAPADIRHVLVGNHDNYVKGRRLSARRSDWPSTASLITSSGLEHRRRRRMLQPLFRQPLIELLVATSLRNAELFSGRVADGQVLDVGRELRALAERNILETVFGPLQDGSLATFAKASRVRSRFTTYVYFSTSPFPEYVPRKLILDQLLARRALDRVLRDAIDRGRRGTADANGHLLALLLGASDDTGARLPDAEVRAELATLTLTGYESVGDALAWTTYLLASHPQLEQMIAEELGVIPASALSGAPATVAPLTTRFVQESLRLYPPTWLFVRRARTDDLLPSGKRVPAGAQLCVSPWIVHRNPALWPDPTRFDPARFAEEEVRGRVRYAYLPFGGGPHTCIGESLALAEIIAVLAVLTSRHRMTAGGQATAEAAMTLRPHGARVRFEPRS